MPCMLCIAEALERIERLLSVQAQDTLAKYRPSISHGHTGACNFGCTCALAMSKQSPDKTVLQGG